MNFLGRFLSNFFMYGVFAAMITALIVFITDIVMEPDRALFRTESAWFSIGLVSIVVGFVVGLARAFGWDGKP